ncbi:Cytoplasmic tRNA 2-thiolation protein 2 [Neonectria punicea]|uniref:Cytoplasmic tRNA 2-thiolation protein 2 n=1 Tax=Neonectria punicea TaxID=979145 RepID=A0ABR1GJU6_9HYPO
MPGSETGRPCKRCKVEDAPFRLRADPTCRDCYVQYVALKMGKRLSQLHRDIRISRQPTARRYIAGLSFGPSSSTFVQLLDDTGRRLSLKKSSSPFNLLVVHIDTDLSASVDSPAWKLIKEYQARFPFVEFDCVPLADVLAVRSIDWRTLPLPAQNDSVTDPAVRLQGLFDALPTATSRADVLRQLIRHLLLHLAITRSCSALLLGHSTSALAALTLSEVANGRGFAVPLQVNDGLCTICTYPAVGSGSDTAEPADGTGRTEFPVYYPMREVFRNEILQYIDIVPSLSGLVPADQMTIGGSSSIVSHKDLSIEEVMARYFDSVEDSYSGIVANVVRTTGKLERIAGDDFCGSCGMTLDEQGDSRWAGELGDDPGSVVGFGDMGRLCYGCKRSIRG